MTHNEMQMQRIAELKTEAATLLSERDAAEAQLAARDKRIAELEAAIESYRTGVDWGKVYAWLQHGAPTEGEGIAMAKRIIHLHVNADALAGGES